LGLVEVITHSTLSQFAPLGHYIALRVRFAFPMEEINNLPKEWVTHYGRKKMLLDDPAMRWAYTKTGAVRWSDLSQGDPDDMIQQSYNFGLRYGAVTSCHDDSGLVSYAMFFRAQNEYSDADLHRATLFVRDLHQQAAPPTNLTKAELEVLRAIRDGHRLKRIAFDLSVTEGAIKQRLRNARAKLGAATVTQAATMASSYGLI
jgi:LuxR family transcriptional regulator, quorum-sensing system regulator SdiA